MATSSRKTTTNKQTTKQKQQTNNNNNKPNKNTTQLWIEIGALCFMLDGKLNVDLNSEQKHTSCSFSSKFSMYNTDMRNTSVSVYLLIHIFMILTLYNLWHLHQVWILFLCNFFNYLCQSVAGWWNVFSVDLTSSIIHVYSSVSFLPWNNAFIYWWYFCFHCFYSCTMPVHWKPITSQ